MLGIGLGSMVLNKSLKKSDQRMGFVEFWADYVKKNPNKVWSKQQADFIDSALKGANTDKELYLKVKKLIRKP